MQTENRPLVYLACPYTGTDEQKDQRFRAVSRAAGRLLSQGVHVYSPISHTHPIAVFGDLPGDWEFWECYDRAVLSCCHKLIVLMLPGWMESTGVQAEIGIASEMGIPVEHIEPADSDTDADSDWHCENCGAELWEGDNARITDDDVWLCSDCYDAIIESNKADPYA